MLDPNNRCVADLPAAQQPLLMVLVDTEEEFDWNRPHSRDAVAVTAVRAQHRAHRIFADYGIRPVYCVDYPVASQADGYAPLRELLDDGLCEIGAHLHPWVNPPHGEAVNYRNSYPGNLAAALEREKLRILTAVIEDNFAATPTLYKAGRYGVGPATTATLAALGYEIDASVVPGSNFAWDEGPDFRRCGSKPYWFGDHRRLLEIPMTVGFTGRLAAHGVSLYWPAAGALGKRLRLPGILARLRLLDRLILTPEGVRHAEHRRLTHSFLETGHRVFCFTYHSPSLAPGCTPYVQSAAELGGFLDKFRRYFDFFVNELGGRAATPGEIKALLPTPSEEWAPTGTAISLTTH